MQFVNLLRSKYIIANFAVTFTGQDGVAACALITTFILILPQSQFRRSINDNDDYLSCMIVTYPSHDRLPFCAVSNMGKPTACSDKNITN